jgi:hypothetical protein
MGMYRFNSYGIIRVSDTPSNPSRHEYERRTIGWLENVIFFVGQWTTGNLTEANERRQDEPRDRGAPQS